MQNAAKILYLTSWLSIMTPSNNQLDSLFAVLANKYRRAIIQRLSLQPSSISELADDLGLSLPAIHKHIALLEEAKYVQRRKGGRTYFIALKRTGLQVAQDWVNQFHTYWGSDDESLENYVKSIENKKLIISNKNLKTGYEKVRISI